MSPGWSVCICALVWERMMDDLLNNCTDGRTKSEKRKEGSEKRKVP